MVLRILGISGSWGSCVGRLGLNGFVSESDHRRRIPLGVSPFCFKYVVGFTFVYL